MKPTKRNKKGVITPDDKLDETLDKAVLAMLSDAVAPVKPADEVAMRMRTRVLDTATPITTTVVRATDGEWKKLLPGITIKTLHTNVEHGTQTSLWRLQPGARVPPHPHSKDEECMVLEGFIVHDGNIYTQGDFLVAKPGVRHKDFLAPEGALLMIRGERIPNKLLLGIAMLMPH
jgi:anti-sigma factor ChrR (cupin superfamily)